MGENEAHVQLSTQQTALFSRPRQLLPGKAKTLLPSLAVLSIQGQRYPLLAYTTTGGLVSSKSYTKGGTSSAIGVYQVVAAIRRVAQSLMDEYRFWMEEELSGNQSRWSQGIDFLKSMWKDSVRGVYAIFKYLRNLQTRVNSVKR